MTLSVFVFDPNDRNSHFIEPAGFEHYRGRLWGTEAMRRRSPMLASIATDLRVMPHEFDEFERQCRLVDAEAKEIVKELSWWGRPTESDIHHYMQNFLKALEFARQHGSDCIEID